MTVTSRGEKAQNEMASVNAADHANSLEHPGTHISTKAMETSQQEDSYYISKSRQEPLDLFVFVRSTPEDPAKRNFIPNLRTHIIGRLLGREFNGDDVGQFTAEESNDLRILSCRMFRHRTMRINYTDDDMQATYDTINPRTHPFIMISSPEREPDAHPFWYAQVLGIFHTQVQHVGPLSRDTRDVHDIEFLWVRWLGSGPGGRSGHKVARLPKIGLVPQSNTSTYGFLDPALVLQVCHLLPCSNDGKTDPPMEIQDATLTREDFKDISEDRVNREGNADADVDAGSGDDRWR